MAKLGEIDLEGVKQAFDLFDQDGSGSISKEEINTVFKELKINLNPQALERIMQNFDSNHDNLIQFDEFLVVISAHLEDPECEGWIFEVFQVLDRDCDGLIKGNELLRASQAYGLGITEKQIELILQEGDPAGEGGICYDEFVRILKLN